MMIQRIYKFGMALVLGALVCGCSQKPPDASKSLPQVTPDTPLVILPPPPISTSKPDVSQELTVFLPNEKGELRSIILKEPGDLAKQKLWQPESALTMLFRKAPEIIPAGTKLTDEIRKNKDYRNTDEPDIYVVFEVRLSKEFSNSPLWHDKKKARLAFEAIVKTAARGISNSIHPTYPFHIHFISMFLSMVILSPN